MNHLWPGNIRELKHCLERACVLSGEAVISPKQLFEDDLPSASPELPPEIESLNDYLQSCEIKHIEDVLRANNGHIAVTAAALGISRKNLWEKMKKLQMQG